MKKILAILLILSLLTPLVLTSGCKAPLNDTTLRRITTAAKVASFVGSVEYMRSHPDSRAAFILARDELRVIETASSVDFTTLLAIIQRLPVKELRDERAQLIITASTLILSDYAGSLPVEQLGQMQPVAKAIADGIEMALQ